jgi:tRNA pseudouridine38-40 synthase
MTGGGRTRVIRLDLEYDGAGFEGWQRQAGGRTVQGVVEEALARVLGERTAVVGAGRTDAGVHARRMPASFRTTAAMEARTLLRALDAVLPEDVGVLAVEDAAPTFHALRDARWKWYRYTVLRSRERRVHHRRTSWRVGAALDLAAVREASAALVGTHDVAAFQSAGSPRRGTVRTVGGLAWTEEGPLLHADVAADGFLYGMVRAIVGTLVECGRGRRDPRSIAALLASRDRRLAGPAAPAHGLTLVAVGYAGDPVPAFVDRRLAAGLESPRDVPTRVFPREEVPPVRILITGRHVGVTEAMKEYAQEKAAKIEKLHDRTQKIQVILDVVRDLHVAEILVDVPRGHVVAKTESPDMFAAIDMAEEKVVHQLVKLKQRGNDHHRGRDSMGSLPPGADGVGPRPGPGGGGPSPGGSGEGDTYEDVVGRMGEE